MKIEDLIPNDKFDNKNIKQLYTLTDEEIKPIIYSLLEWIQDYNWPVAQEMIHVLKKRENLIFPYISEILNGDDISWKYWVMELLIPDFTFEHKSVLKGDILKLINKSETDEDTESIRECAIECYKNCGFKY